MSYFEESLKIHNINLSEDMLHSFEAFYNDLIVENQKYNLTRIVSRDQVYSLHFYDSLMVTLATGDLNGKKLLDVGSGAGFPGIPLKIAFPQLSITMIEATNKKVNFINQEIEKLHLINARALHLRAEDFKEFNKYDFVTSRAVSSIKEMITYTLPFLKIGGLFVAMKSAAQGFDEAEMSKQLLIELGGKVTQIIPYVVLDHHYVLVVITKINATPSTHPKFIHQEK